jgi:hypothetical protein
MVDIVLLQTVSIVIASAGVFAAAIYYIFQIRHQTKVRQTDLIMRLYSQVCTREFMDAYLKNINLKVKDYSEFVEKYGTLTSEGPEQSAFLMGSMFLEGIGVLLHRKLVDVEVIRELFPVETWWKKSEPIIKDYRKQTGLVATFEWFEYLYNEVKKREQKLQS